MQKTLAEQSEAELAFVNVLREHLAMREHRKKHSELKDIANSADDAPGAIEAWARRWHLNAPCVIEWACDAVAMRRDDGHDLDEGTMRRFRDAGADLLDSRTMISFEQGRAVPTIAAGDEWNRLTPEVLREARRRGGAGLDPWRPIAADIGESQKQFLSRARAHWNARRDAAPRFDRHDLFRESAAWLLWSQWGASTDDILGRAALECPAEPPPGARRDGPPTAEYVRKARREFAALIGLEVRRESLKTQTA